MKCRFRRKTALLYTRQPGAEAYDLLSCFGYHSLLPVFLSANISTAHTPVSTMDFIAAFLYCKLLNTTNCFNWHNRGYLTHYTRQYLYLIVSNHEN